MMCCAVRQKLHSRHPSVSCLPLPTSHFPPPASCLLPHASCSLPGGTCTFASNAVRLQQDWPGNSSRNANPCQCMNALRDMPSDAGTVDVPVWNEDLRGAAVPADPPGESFPIDANHYEASGQKRVIKLKLLHVLKPRVGHPPAWGRSMGCRCYMNGNGCGAGLGTFVFLGYKDDAGSPEKHVQVYSAGYEAAAAEPLTAWSNSSLPGAPSGRW